MKRIIKFFSILLCYFGIHKWEYVLDNKMFPFSPYKYCKRCGQIKTNFY